MATVPSVSVVIVNLNGRALLSDCLVALAAQTYPVDRLDIVVVDNGSTDDSVVFLREHYPQVQVVEAGRNLGFAGGNNLGARAVRGDYLAFINNDAVADPNWLAASVEALIRQPDYACAASKMLNGDGSAIDFVGSVLNLYGRAFQIDEDWPVSADFYDTPREILAPCGGAMVIRRETFLAVGGFDEDYIAYYEDVDLGWRLWLLGYKVLFIPEALVYHAKHQTGEGFPVEQRYALSELNALRTVIKNYEEAHLWRILPVSLLLGVRRSLDQAQLDRSLYHFGRRRADDPKSGILEPELKMTRVATAYLVAMDQIAEEFPYLLAKRHRIQEARRRSDAEIFSLFPLQPDNPLFPWKGYHVVQDQLAAASDLPETLRPRRGSRLLIITHETVGSKMSGPGIRAWEMACALVGQFEVTLAAVGSPTRQHPGLRVVGYDLDDPQHRQLHAYVNSTDVILAMGTLFTMIPLLRDLNKPVIVDLYDPFELEKLAQSTAIDPHFQLQIDLESLFSLQLQGSIGDFFICASERQRDFWLGTLLATGRVNTVTYAQDPTLRQLIDVVPFGLPTDSPRHDKAVLKGVQPGIEPDDKVLFWNGGLWQWFDPLTLVEALDRVRRVRTDVKLFFAAGRHFDTGTVPEMPIYAQTIARGRELDLLDKSIFFGDWIPYDERGNYLLEADLGVSLHRPTLESHFASRTRLLDCIWAGLPVIVTEGDPLAELVAACGLGYKVPASDPDRLAQVILDLLADESLRQRAADQVEGLRQELAWSRVVKPIADFLTRAAFAPDALTAVRTATQARSFQSRIHSLEQHIRGLEMHISDLQAHLQAIQQGRVLRLLNKLDALLHRK